MSRTPLRNSRPDEVGDVVAGGAAERSASSTQSKTVVAKKVTVRQHAGQQQRDVSLDHHEEKDGIETVATDEVVKKIEMHD